MAKLPRVRYAQSGRLEAPFHQRPYAHARHISPVHAYGPLTPSEFFVWSLQADENMGLDINTPGPGAYIPVLLKTHVEVDLKPCTKSPIYVLVVRVETPLPTGGTYTTRLDSWEIGPAPLWLVGKSSRSTRPIQFTRTLGWLHAVVSAIEARPARRECDVWWRFLRFVNNVKEAYRTTPPLEILNGSRDYVKPRPRPRRRQTDLSNLADALAVLRLTNNEEGLDEGMVSEL